MSEQYKEKIREYEECVRAIMREREEILQKEGSLTAVEVDRLFDSAHEIDQLFEHQSMLLPLVEDEKSVSRWDSPADQFLNSLLETHTEAVSIPF